MKQQYVAYAFSPAIQLCEYKIGLLCILGRFVFISRLVYITLANNTCFTGAYYRCDTTPIATWKMYDGAGVDRAWACPSLRKDFFSRCNEFYCFPALPHVFVVCSLKSRDAHSVIALSSNYVTVKVVCPTYVLYVSYITQGNHPDVDQELNGQIYITLAIINGWNAV